MRLPLGRGVPGTQETNKTVSCGLSRPRVSRASVLPCRGSSGCSPDKGSSGVIGGSCGPRVGHRAGCLLMTGTRFGVCCLLRTLPWGVGCHAITITDEGLGTCLRSGDRSLKLSSALRPPELRLVAMPRDGPQGRTSSSSSVTCVCACSVTSIMSDLQSHGLWPDLLCPWILARTLGGCHALHP